MHLLAQYFQKVLAFTPAIRYKATSSAIMSLQQFAEANNVSADFCSALAMMEAPMVHDDAVIIKVAKTFKVFSHLHVPLRMACICYDIVLPRRMALKTCAV